MMVMHFVKILMFTFWAVLDFALFGLFLLPVLEFAVSADTSCVDTKSDCPILKEDGWCENKPALMKKFCPRSCKMCVAECDDKRKDCKRFRLYGWCKNRVSSMEKVCPATCNLCQHNSVTKTQVKEKVSKKKPVKVKPAIQPKAKCTDAYGKSRCEYYRTMGWCQSHPTMRIHCKNTCVCNNKPISKLRSKPCSATKYGCCWDRKTTKESKDGKGCPSCENDTRFKVLCERFGDDCDGRGNLAKSLMKYCPKRCGLC